MAAKHDDPEVVIEPDQSDDEIAVDEPAVNDEEEREPETSDTPDQEAEATQPEQPSKKPAKTPSGNWLHRLRRWRPNRKQCIIGGAVFAIFLLLSVIPLTRNLVLGTVFKTSLSVEVYDEYKDDDTGNMQRIELSGVDIAIDGKQVIKNGTSPLTISGVKPGKRTVTIQKTNYKTEALKLTANLSFGSQHNSLSKKLTATGRQAKVQVTDFVTDQPISGVTVSYKSSTAKTDKDGQAIITVPIEAKNSYELKLTKDKYNASTQTITVQAKPTTKAQTLHLTPAGKVYFLSRASGKIDVVKSNLDGTNRQTVLAGTGSENESTTTMISTTDWRYLALSTHRADNKSQIIVIDTQTDAPSTVDEGNATFNLYGWDGKKLVYTSENQDTPVWKTGRNRIKSYDAESKKLAVLYQTVATGTSDSDYQSETIAQVSLVDHRVLYLVTNYTAGSTSRVFSTTITTGTQKTLFSYNANQLNLYINFTSYDEAYYTGYSYTDSKYSYYQVSESNEWKTIAKLPDDQRQLTYFISPDGQHLLWSEERDGKQTVFLGDSSAQNAQKLYSLSELKPYAWLSDDYALYSKKDSELYIAPVKANSTPKKITDYHRPSAISFRGYGGGGGGPY